MKNTIPRPSSKTLHNEVIKALLEMAEKEEQKADTDLDNRSLHIARAVALMETADMIRGME